MATISIDIETSVTFGDLLKQLGSISPRRVLIKPPPGTATIKDVTAALEGPRKRICELIDGTLVEKVMGAPESILAGILMQLIRNFLDQHPLGTVMGEAGFMRIAPQLALAPDVSFISWDRLPGRRPPTTPVPAVAPNLAIEVLSPGNTKKEMTRKITELFKAGTEEIWLIQPKKETAEIYSSPKRKRKIDRSGTLEGGTILPGFRLSMAELFDRMSGQVS